jgi:hypothetical protein
LLRSHLGPACGIFELRELVLEHGALRDAPFEAIH